VSEFESEHFDLILMDVQMPVMDGVEATLRIRSLEAGRDRRVPIIAVTALSAEGDRERCFAAGVDAFLAKPLDPPLLDDVIMRYVAEVSADFEHARALELVAGDQDLLASVVRLFLQETPQNLAALQGALARRDARTLEDTAHTIEGSAARLAMPRLRDVAHHIAVLSQRGEFEAAAVLMADLDAAFGHGASAIKRSIGSA
jgi:CheY-like chemotaxis protein